MEFCMHKIQNVETNDALSAFSIREALDAWDGASDASNDDRCP